MRVLIAGETSGRSRNAFRLLGHDAWSCDLLECEDGSEFHIVGDMFEVAGRYHWDLVIAHPSCTYLCSSGLHWNLRVPGRAEKTEEALADVRRLMALPVKRIAIENPAGRIGTQIREADQYVHPHQFGDDASKRTGLWLKGLAPLVADPKDAIPPRWVCCKKVISVQHHRPLCPDCLGEKSALPRWANQTNSGQNKLAPSKDRWRERSRTYEGIANAMAAQWGGWLMADIDALIWGYTPSIEIDDLV